MANIREWREAAATALISEARELLAAGHILALPTETFYALAANPFDDGAMARLKALKERPEEKPILVLVAAPKMLYRVARAVPEVAETLMARFWPGPLTLILPARPEISRILTGGTDTVGVRQPRQPITCRLLAALDLPLTGTSANRSGRQALTQAEEVAREFGEALPLILDTGPCPGGLPSTIVDVSREVPRLVRPGAIETTSLLKIIPEMKTE